MQQHLKEVREIFPEAILQVDRIIWIPIKFLKIYKYKEYELRLTGNKKLGEPLICYSKDFSKILAVLKAIKECK